MHRIIRVYSLLAVLLDPIVHVFLENTVYGVYTVHRIIRVYSMLSKEKGPYGATMTYRATAGVSHQGRPRHLPQRPPPSRIVHKSPDALDDLINLPLLHVALQAHETAC